MNQYNPEDIEELMLHKSFNELLEEEKNFVLLHVKDEEDYTQMRATLLAIKESINLDEHIVASPQIKENLLQLFEKKERKGFLWLWSYLFPSDKPLFYRPAMKFATVLTLFIGTFLVLNNFKHEENTTISMIESDTTEENIINREKQEERKPNLSESESLKPKKESKETFKLTDEPSDKGNNSTSNNQPIMLEEKKKKVEYNPKSSVKIGTVLSDMDITEDAEIGDNSNRLFDGVEKNPSPEIVQEDLPASQKPLGGYSDDLKTGADSEMSSKLSLNNIATTTRSASRDAFEYNATAIPKSRNLSQDKDWIELFTVAM